MRDVEDVLLISTIFSYKKGPWGLPRGAGVMAESGQGTALTGPLPPQEELWLMWQSGP